MEENFENKSQLFSFPILNCFDTELLGSYSMKALTKQMNRIQMEIKYMCDELEPKDYSRVNKFSQKFKNVIVAVNELVNSALHTMMENSVAKLLKVLRFFTTSFDYCRDETD